MRSFKNALFAALFLICLLTLVTVTAPALIAAMGVTLLIVVAGLLTALVFWVLEKKEGNNSNES